MAGLTFLLLCSFVALSAQLKCGVNRASYIFNGERVSRYKYPWMVNLRYRDGRKSDIGHNVLCGGVAITPNLVITAAHCLYPNRQQNQKTISPGELYIYYWSYNVTKENDKKDLRVPVTKIFVHPYYDMKTNSFDMAILQTSYPIHKVQPICLPCKTGIHKPFEATPRDTCVAVGWGLTEELETSEVPLEAEIPIRHMRGCEFSWKQMPDESMLCAGKGRFYLPTTCQGDSGGPLMCERNGYWFLSGITSWGAINCWQKPAIFSNVVKMRNWITLILSKFGQEEYCPEDHMKPKPLARPIKGSKKRTVSCDATLFGYEKGVYMVANFTRKNYQQKNISHFWECSRICCNNKQCKSALYYPKYKECYQFVNRLCELNEDKVNRNYKEDDVIYYGKPGGCHGY